ncbi:MAG: prolyl oligopeptidase family serine peptidase [Burkholderiaceae bacterium]|nr:prolyl oligopeptidase family serine peptidase [Burkholderiaceae bacterium]
MNQAFRPVRLAAVTLLAALLAACGSSDNHNDRGAMKSTTQTAAVPKASIDASVAAQPGLDQLIGAAAARCDVSVNRLIYDTRDPQDNDAEASAGVLIPSGCTGPFPILVYHHGTSVLKADTMSDPANGEMGLQMAMYAAQGYVVVMPDYHGYSGSTMNYHPYLNAANTAVVSIDALRAAKKMVTDKGVALSGKLFLAGYSQGGHAAMATQRALEKDYRQEFTVTASVPMSGPYVLSQTIIDQVDNPAGQRMTLFAPMIFVGFQKAYGDVYANPNEVFQSPWVNGIESLLPGALTGTQLFTQGKLPLAIRGPGGLLTDTFINRFKTDVTYPARKRAMENDLLDFKPTAPTALCAGARDPVVPAKNMITAVTYFAGQGVQVTPVDVEQVPQFRAAIDAQVAAAPDLSTYHANIVLPLCASVAKNQFFDPRK